QRREVEDNLILEWLIGLYDEQTRSVPRLCRAHCDPLIGELKIKEIDAHGALRPCRVSGSYVSSNTHGDDGIRIAHRLAALDLVDVFHAFNDLAPNRVLTVQERSVLEADEELRVGR